MFHADRPPNLISELTPYWPYFAENQTTLEGFTHNILGPRYRIKPAGVPAQKIHASLGWHVANPFTYVHKRLAHNRSFGNQHRPLTAGYEYPVARRIWR